jgi:cytochrome o ubiquinol oxidase subunit 3
MENHNINNKGKLGFWIYLMTDLIMFAVLFATYAVLRDNTFGGITIHEIFDPPFVLTETLILLTSSFTVGLGILYARRMEIQKTIVLLFLTLFLGISFLVMEISEFTKLITEGNSFTASAFLSSFFTLIGTHGLHIFIGSFWILVMLVYIEKRGLTPSNIKKLTLLGLFWHFLDIVWIFIFTIVYLMGGIK